MIGVKMSSVLLSLHLNLGASCVLIDRKLESASKDVWVEAIAVDWGVGFENKSFVEDLLLVSYASNLWHSGQSGQSGVDFDRSLRLPNLEEAWMDAFTDKSFFLSSIIWFSPLASNDAHLFSKRAPSKIQRYKFFHTITFLKF